MVLSHPSTGLVAVPSSVRQALGDRFDIRIWYQDGTRQYHVTLYDRNTLLAQRQVISEEVLIRSEDAIEAAIMHMARNIPKEYGAIRECIPAHYPSDGSYPHLDDELDA